MKRKILLSIVLALTLAFVPSLLSMTALASEIFGASLQIVGADRTLIEIRQNESASGDGWSYDPDSKTLTLNGFNGRNIVVYRFDDITIDLKGDNSTMIFNIHDGSDGGHHTATILGDGTLNAENVRLLIEDVKILSGTINCTESMEISGYAAYKTDGAVMTGTTLVGGTVNVTNSSNTGKAVDVSLGALEVTGGTLNVVGGNYGIGGNGKVTLAGGTVTVQGKEAAICLNQSFRPVAGLLTINGTITGGDTVGSSQSLSVNETEDLSTVVISGSSGAAKYVRFEGSNASAETTQSGNEVPTADHPWSKASDWAVPELEKAANLGLIPESLYGTDMTAPISRAEFAAVAVQVYEALSPTPALPAINVPFKDTRDMAVSKAYNLGIVAGVSSDMFSPDTILNREQCSTMLTRVIKKLTIVGWTLETDGQFALPYTPPAPFVDDADISDWARDSVYFMVANGIINGLDGNRFAPRNLTTVQESTGYANATREQALAIAVRMVESRSY